MAAKFSRLPFRRQAFLQIISTSLRLALKPYTGTYCRIIAACYSSVNEDCRATLFVRAREFPDRTAVIDNNSSFTYSQLLQYSKLFGQQIVQKSIGKGGEDLEGKRVAFLCPSDVSYVAVQWAIWRNGGIAVPLCSTHPVNMLEYFITDSQSTLLVSTEQFRSKLNPLVQTLDIPHLEVSIGNANSQGDSSLTPFERRQTSWDENGAMIFYTSGTTGKPKGVLTTHGNVRSQVSGMVKAWQWTKNDCILHVLPLHHVHGVINVLACPLWVGATCVMLQEFNPKKVWQHLTSSKLSLFMAVPTIYSKLIEHFHKGEYNETKQEIKRKCSQLRLMVSGSSALPEPIMTEWHNITGHTLLERYGMTEIGMGLSNPLHGRRIPGSVGTPLPGVQVRIVAKDEQGLELDEQILVEGDEHGSNVNCNLEDLQGALQVRGPSVFKSYWQKPDATSESFTSDGWFRTGDSAAYKDGVYKILGRASVDIIKSGGYKISALDVERELLAHPHIRDCAVLAVPDTVWGERVAALVALHSDTSLTLKDLRTWSEERLSNYQTPSILKVVAEISRNTMGKVNKKELVKMFHNENQEQ